MSEDDNDYGNGESEDRGDSYGNGESVQKDKDSKKINKK